MFDLFDLLPLEAVVQFAGFARIAVAYWLVAVAFVASVPKPYFELKAVTNTKQQDCLPISFEHAVLSIT